MKKLIFTILAFLMVFCLAQTGSASIMYSVTDGTGPRYGLAFDVKNESSSGVSGFAIFFGQTDDDGLSFTNWNECNSFSPDDTGTGPESQPAGWFSYSFEPSPAFYDPGQFNSEINTGVLASGASATGFNVTFNWTGTGSYARLWYELYDENLEVAESGYTELKDPGTNVVPEPGTILLLGFGLLGTAAISRKKRN